jgi:hypothetical protein
VPSPWPYTLTAPVLHPGRPTSCGLRGVAARWPRWSRCLASSNGRRPSMCVQGAQWTPCSHSCAGRNAGRGRAKGRIPQPGDSARPGLPPRPAAPRPAPPRSAPPRPAGRQVPSPCGRPLAAAAATAPRSPQRCPPENPSSCPEGVRLLDTDAAFCSTPLLCRFQFLGFAPSRVR